MNVNDLIAHIRDANIASTVLMVRGAPGIGKSAAILQASAQRAEDLGLKAGVIEYGDQPAEGFGMKDGFGFIDVRLSQCDPVDIGGLPVASVHGTQDRLVPDWFPFIGREDVPDYGILALEEIVSAPMSVQAAAYQLTHDRRIGSKRMKPGWSIVMTGNRMTDGGVVFKMPTPLANRATHIDVESDLDCWRSWGLSQGNIETCLLAFMAMRPDLLNTFDDHVTKKLEGDAFATERSWVMVDRYEKAKLPADRMYNLAMGSVGKGPAAEYIAFRDVWLQMPSIEAILLNPHSAPLPDDSATQYAVAVALGARTTHENQESVFNYLERFAKAGRPEMAVLSIQDSLRRDSTLSQTSTFNKWAISNASLISGV
jgi:hypothetical protein